MAGKFKNRKRQGSNKQPEYSCTHLNLLNNTECLVCTLNKLIGCWRGPWILWCSYRIPGCKRFKFHSSKQFGKVWTNHWHDDKWTWKQRLAIPAQLHRLGTMKPCRLLFKATQWFTSLQKVNAALGVSLGYHSTLTLTLRRWRASTSSLENKEQRLPSGRRWSTPFPGPARGWSLRSRAARARGSNQSACGRRLRASRARGSEHGSPEEHSWGNGETLDQSALCQRALFPNERPPARAPSKTSTRPKLLTVSWR